MQTYSPAELNTTHHISRLFDCALFFLCDVYLYDEKNNAAAQLHTINDLAVFCCAKMGRDEIGIKRANITGQKNVIFLIGIDGFECYLQLICSSLHLRK